MTNEEVNYERPAIVFDDENSIMLRWGEYHHMVSYLDDINKVYRASGLHDIADRITLLELPSNDLLEHFINHTGSLDLYLNPKE